MIYRAGRLPTQDFSYFFLVLHSSQSGAHIALILVTILLGIFLCFKTAEMEFRGTDTDVHGLYVRIATVRLTKPEVDDLGDVLIYKPMQSASVLSEAIGT